MAGIGRFAVESALNPVGAGYLKLHPEAASYAAPVIPPCQKLKVSDCAP